MILVELRGVLQSLACEGRPILFEKHEKLPGCYLVLGIKIDNICDVLEKLETEYIKSDEMMT
jgi:hypothetical protein